MPKSKAGFSAEEIKALINDALRSKSEVNTEDLIDAFADVIAKNNASLVQYMKENVSDIVQKDLSDKLRRKGIAGL
ncbi:hypothetical protein SAMN05216312_102235 [Cohnella sp. OV330]|uniref:hypothetical protein n=1 Tax=Cohnella sp. OV330 TaxID=1855288 RepID=UPI0008EEB86A|nr:hypothetical protein [Cohnella sp. OV330]SFA91859.1 hypothetical protein SAMN05216312_102235 [Cohnella sp. OV330]